MLYGPMLNFVNVYFFLDNLNSRKSAYKKFDIGKPNYIKKNSKNCIKDFQNVKNI